MSRTIAVTGSNGFIGRAIVEALIAAGHEVWGVDLTAGSSEKCLAADLLQATQTRAAFARLPRCDVVIHLAALAHGQPPPPGESCFTTNTKITSNLLAAVQDAGPQLVFFSSVAVYGEEGRVGPVLPTVELRPATEYGQSKRICEELLLATSLENIDILRLAPVFAPGRLHDVRKRVFLPLLPFRCQMMPPPDYSFCSLATVVAVVAERVARGPGGRIIQNVADARPYSQRELLTWFSGPTLPVPLGIARMAYFALKLVPGRLGYQMRSLYSKLFCSNVYSLEEHRWPAALTPPTPTRS